MEGGSVGLQDASLGLESLMLRVLDPPAASSGDEQEAYSSRSDASSKAVRKLRRGAGRMKRTASAPAPPLLNMLSRTGKALETDRRPLHAYDF